MLSLHRFGRWRPLALMLAASAALLARQAVAENIKIGLLRVTAGAPVYIAQEKGYFAAEGLAPELVFFESAQPVSLAVASGDIDFGLAALTAGLYNLCGQGALRIIAGNIHEAQGFPGNVFIASNRAFAAGLKSLKDLPGHSFAVSQFGDPAHYSLALVAEKYHFDLTSVRVLALQSLPNMISAVSGGQVDVGLPPTTLARPLIQRGEVKALAWVGDETPWQLGAVWTATKTANQRRDLVERFLRAYRAGARAYHDAFVGTDGKPLDGPTAPEVRSILAKYTEQSAESFKLGVTYIDAEARLDVKDVLHQIAWYKSQGMLSAGVDGDQIIDKRYVVALPEQ